MPEIIDILSCQVNAAPTFTVNNAVNSVDLTPNPAGAQKMYVGGNLSKFARGDNFIIHSFGYFIPEGFRFYSYEDGGVTHYPFPLLVIAALKSGGGPSIPVSSFGNLGAMRVPFPNYEFACGTFTDAERLGLTDATFELQESFPYPTGSDTVQISMINVPAALNGIIFPVIPWIKVLHNVALS